ncbi:MAG: hypothetical protein IKV22_01785 [Paludibacteraceae bacterium]|nr:hypothetical protein [Paludibacteraceae bacterium]
MKKITLLLSAMLMTVMSFGAVVTFDADADKGNATETAAAFTVTKDGITLDVTQGRLGTFSGETHYRIYKSQTLTIKSTVGAITSVQFTCTAEGDAQYGPGCFTVADGSYTYSGAVGTWTGSATEITFSATTNQVRASQIVVAIDGDVIPGGGNGGGNDNDSTGTVPPAEGVITCAQAVEICKATGETATTETYTIRGYVTEIKEAYTTQYGNVSCWMADEKGGGQVFLAFRVKPVNAADQAVKVNDYIEVKGNLVNYYGNTPETTAGGSMTIITVGEEGEKPSLPEGLTGDGTKENPFTVEDVLLLNNNFAGPYYVKAFIVGQVNGASLESGAEFDAPFTPSSNSTTGEQYTYGTNLIVASSVDITDVAKCVPVQLPAGDLRTNFNLPENPDMHGQEVLICGSLQKYFSVPGIKSPTSIELLSEVSNVVNVKGMQYADAYYYTEDEIGYFDFDMYVDVDPDTYEYTYPELYVAVKANSKTALNGTYDLLYAGLWTSANDSIEMGEALGTVTIKNVDTEGNYSFTGSFVGADGKTYKFNDVMYVWGYDVDTDEEIAFSEESTTPPTNGAIVFDADTDQGNAIVYTEGASGQEFTITKEGLTITVSSGLLGTYNNEHHYRIYKNQTLTVTSTVGNIAKIEFTCTANGDEKYGPGCFTASTGEYGHDGAAVGTWTGDAATITFTASANQVRATQIVVTLASATAVDNVTVGATPVKVIENGQVLIIRGENIYNVLGAQVK